MGLEFLRHARDVVHHRTCGVASVFGGVGAVEHIDALDFLGRDKAPARCVVGAVGNAVAEKIGQQNAVRIDHRTHAVARAGRARGENRVVVVADVALAHHEAGQVLERVFAVGGIDARGDLFARHAFDGDGELRGQIAGLATFDGDGIQRFFLRGVGDFVGVGVGIRMRQHGDAQHERHQRAFHFSSNLGGAGASKRSAREIHGHDTRKITRSDAQA